MNQDGDCKGRLSAAGHFEPAREVNFNLSHKVVTRQSPDGRPVEWTKATIHSVLSADGSAIPQGDFNLVARGEMLRLKHIDNHQRWLVLSGNG